MSIQPVGINTRNLYSFRANQPNYENPVNRNTERNLAVIASVGGSAVAGVLAGLATSIFTKNNKIKLLVGLITGLAALGLTLPSKLYNTKVNAYARQKEMDVFSRQKSAQSNIYEDIDNEIKDNDVSLDDKINHYATVKMADNGNGVMIKGV